MIRSMTGYGRASVSIDDASLLIEVRTLNHRHADISVRLPRGFSAMEQELRRLAKEAVRRGRVDIVLTYSGRSSGETEIQIASSAVAEYVRAGKEIAVEYDLEENLSLNVLLPLPGVVNLSESIMDMSSYSGVVSETLAEALSVADLMRQKEGSELEREMRGQVDRVTDLIEGLEARAEVVVQVVRERLRKRANLLKEETGILDDARLHQEVVFASDKMDIREELVRLTSHAEVFLKTLSEGPGPIGRRLDFLLQEMSREANTIGSKAADASLSHLVVDLKTELERIREQVQNVE